MPTCWLYLDIRASEGLTKLNGLQYNREEWFLKNRVWPHEEVGQVGTNSGTAIHIYSLQFLLGRKEDKREEKLWLLNF